MAGSPVVGPGHCAGPSRHQSPSWTSAIAVRQRTRPSARAHVDEHLAAFPPRLMFRELGARRPQSRAHTSGHAPFLCAPFYVHTHCASGLQRAPTRCDKPLCRHPLPKRSKEAEARCWLARPCLSPSSNILLIHIHPLVHEGGADETQCVKERAWQRQGRRQMRDTHTHTHTTRRALIW